jgi:biopolymer transport protein ExbD
MAATPNDSDDLISGINVTPLVDVTLVLLIIFMVTAKIIVSQGMPMDLPKAARGEEVQMNFSVEITKEGETFVDGRSVPDDASLTKLAEEAKAKNKDLRATIRADKRSQHGRFVEVLDLLRRAGIAKIAISVAPKATDAPGGGTVEAETTP